MNDCKKDDNDRIALAIKKMEEEGVLFKSSLTKDETMVLFDIVNRKYSAKSTGSLVITSNTQPSLWTGIFQDSILAECILDRLFDRSYCFHFTGESYRGKDKIVTQVNFGHTAILPKVR